MTDESQSIWKRSWQGPRGYLFGVVALLAASFVIFTIIGLILGCAKDALAVAGSSAGIILAGLIVFGLLAAFVRWLFSQGWRWTLMRLAGFAGLIVLFYAEEFVRGKWAWENFRREWEAKGEKFDRQAVVPQPVPDDQNFAMTPIVFTGYGKSLTRDGKAIPYEKSDANFVNRMEIPASDYSLSEPTNGVGDRAKALLTDLKPWQDYYRTLAATTNLFPVSPQSQSPAADVLFALSKYDAAIEELRQASWLPASRFPLNYGAENPSLILLPHLAPLKNATRTLKLRSIAELQNGESGRALADVVLMLRLPDSIRTEPILISHLVRIATLQITLQPIYEGLAEHRWTDAQLAELNLELAKLDFLADYQFVMRGELAIFQVGTLEYARRHPKMLLPVCHFTMDGFHPSAFDDWLAKSAAHLIPSGWFYQNQLRCARLMVKNYIPLADVKQNTFSPSGVRQADAALETETAKITPYNWLERLLLPALSKAAKKFAYAQSSTDLAHAAIALERYHLAHVNYPETLDVLAPQFMEKIPHDIINGQPLKYRRETNGQFILYSVGWNEADDGGVVAYKEYSQNSVDVNKGDWVWRYPQK